MLQNLPTAAPAQQQTPPETDHRYIARLKREEEIEGEKTVVPFNDLAARRLSLEVSVLAHRLARLVESGSATSSTIDKEKLQLASMHIKAATAFAANAFCE